MTQTRRAEQSSGDNVLHVAFTTGADKCMKSKHKQSRFHQSFPPPEQTRGVHLIKGITVEYTHGKDNGTRIE